MTSEPDEERRYLRVPLDSHVVELWYEYEEGQWVHQVMPQSQWDRADAMARELYWGRLQAAVGS